MLRYSESEIELVTIFLDSGKVIASMGQRGVCLSQRVREQGITWGEGAYSP